MKRILFVLTFWVVTISANGQDLTKIGASINGTKVTIDNKNPIGFKDSVDSYNFLISSLNDVGADVKVANNSNEMIYFSYNDSYFIVEGKTESIIAGKTLMIDKDKAILDVKIAPKTSVLLELINKPRVEEYGTIWYMFSNKKANSIYKRSHESDKVSMMLVLKKENGDKITKEFNFTVRGSAELKDLKKSQQ